MEQLIHNSIDNILITYISENQSNFHLAKPNMFSHSLTNVETKGASGGVMLRKLDSQTFTSKFESHCVSHSCGFVLHISKNKTKNAHWITNEWRNKGFWLRLWSFYVNLLFIHNISTYYMRRYNKWGTILSENNIILIHRLYCGIDYAETLRIVITARLGPEIR